MLDSTRTALISVPKIITGEYSVPVGVSIILDNAFEGCEHITCIRLPNTIQAIGNNCFQDCLNLHKITIPQSVQYIAPQCFLNSSIVSIEFESPNFLTYKIKYMTKI